MVIKVGKKRSRGQIIGGPTKFSTFISRTRAGYLLQQKPDQMKEPAVARS